LNQTKNSLFLTSLCFIRLYYLLFLKLNTIFHSFNLMFKFVCFFISFYLIIRNFQDLRDSLRLSEMLFLFFILYLIFDLV